MKLSMKAVAASVLFAVAGGSQAAIVSGYANPATDGELFISIFRDDASPASMIVDTNMSLFDIRSGATSSWTSSAAQTAAIQAFLGTGALSDFRFNAGGVTNAADFMNTDQNADFATWFTSNAAVTKTLLNYDGASLNNPRAKTHEFITDTNNAYVSSPSFNNDGYVGGILPGQFGFHNSPAWGNNIGGTAAVNTEGQVGTNLALWNAFVSCTDMFCSDVDVQQFGSLGIDGVTGVASFGMAPSAVPVPAAVWLLGSGLVGLVGVARRRKV